MGSYHNYNLRINVNPPLPVGTSIGIVFSPLQLANVGLNIPVIISAASALSPDPNQDAPTENPEPPIAVMAHLDTGASKTSIDVKLAQQLKLKAYGKERIATASGVCLVPTFAVNLHFQNASLAPFIDLPISSCHLPFDITKNLSDPRNFALLIGRDILSRWNIVWNGQTSTVIIND
jgi:hypothetical protein